MRPPGPVPWSSRRSTPVWAAIFFASGEAFTRPPDGWAATAAAGALVTGDGRMGGRGDAAGVGAGVDGAATASAGAPARAGAAPAALVVAGAALAGAGAGALAISAATSSPGSAM